MNNSKAKALPQVLTLLGLLTIAAPDTSLGYEKTGGACDYVHLELPGLLQPSPSGWFIETTEGSVAVKKSAHLTDTRYVRASISRQTKGSCTPLVLNRYQTLPLVPYPKSSKHPQSEIEEKESDPHQCKLTEATAFLNSPAAETIEALSNTHWLACWNHTAPTLLPTPQLNQ
ncbi:hypothetical protein [Simiduia agarivorans]|uniref:Uncharacterized protein n=1 Tax=Simiduia agarivorans (strain DSM 21679 / JCM 13881 / BCRC 17597 / SA1) TaxID=1117647 RepID=K4KED7_SIMAS|nr:hypothetical protein [Simiduia agarivorans]AFU97414.1 hypothetical protein M5M_00905 [Simiduia agarivorans SA1 = DSM 21679]